MANNLGGYWKLAEVLKGMTDAEPPKAGTATVRDVDGDGTVWVVPTGSDEAVPVTGMSVASVSSGDVVTVEANGGRLSITGNATAPAVGSTYVRETVEPVEATANRALGDAERAAAAADEAEGEAKRAHEAADAAQLSADEAAGAASDAKASATTANTAANDALTQLSTVQDVVGVVEWAAAHSEQDMATYISSHLSLTDAGLWVTLDDTGYKLLVAATGVSVVDPQGHTVSTYGESVRFDSSRPQYIGGEDAHISYYDSDDDGVPDSIYIGGTNVTIGGKTLSQFTQAIDDATAARRYAEDVPIVTLSSTNGTVFKRNSGVSTTVVATIFTPAGRIDNATELHRRFGAGAYLEWGWRNVVTDAAHVLVLSDPRIIMDGFGLVVSPDDINTQAVITCSLNY